MKSRTRNLLSLLAFLSISSNTSLYSAPALKPTYPLAGALATGAYAFGTRYLSKQVAGHYMEQNLAPLVEDFNKLTLNGTSSNMMVHPSHPVLVQIDMSIVLWTAFKMLLASGLYGKDYLATGGKAAAAAAGYNLAHMAGMDTLCVVEDIQTAHGI